MTEYTEWKWTKGEKFERSLRDKKNKEFESTIQNCIDINLQPRHSIPEIEETHIAEHNMEDRQFMNFNVEQVEPGFIHKQNKLDGQNEKLSSRHMIVQKGINPFVDTSNYLEHLDMETSFLRPRDSNHNEKQGNSSNSHTSLSNSE